MYSHLCRCCLSEFNNSSEIVPLFERYKNIWYHRLISATFRLSLTRDDNLGSNICKMCAVEILKSYKFRLKYIESERKLLKMLDQFEQQQYESLLDVEVTVDEKNLPSATTDSRWKCNSCPASFATRSQYYEHRRISKKVTSDMVNNAEHLPTNKNVRQNRWKCDYCPVEFGTNKLKLKHERDEHSDNISFHEPTILIEDDDSVNEALISSVKTELNVDADQNDQYIDQEPEVDLGPYLIAKHSQMSSFDPLEINNFNDSLLTPLNVTETDNPNSTNSKWKCRLCTEAFRTRDQLREHNHLHMAFKGPKPVVPKVEKVKVEKVQNSTPVKLFTNELNAPKWQCKTCKLIFGTRELLRTHRRAYFLRDEITGLREMQCDTELADHTASKRIKIEEIDELC